MSWKTVKLKDACSKIGSGATPKGGATVYLKNGTSLIRSQNVYNLHFDYSGLAHITEEAANKLNNVIVEKNDVLLNITGDSVARTCIVPNDVLPARVNQHVAILRTNEGILNSKFLCYYLASPYMQRYMLGLAVGKGASRNAMTKSMIEGFSVPCPSTTVQRRIANILSAYDDVIENNQKQINLLEEAAQRMYKEWFVDLRFPGYKEISIVDGIPDGWRRELLVDIANVQYGYAFDSSLFNSDCKGVPIVRIRNIPLGTTDDYTTEEVNSQYLVQNGDIVVGMDGEFHINSWCGETAYLVQRTCRIAPYNLAYKGYLFLALYEPIKFFEKTVVGATVSHLGKKHIDTISLLIPPEHFTVCFQKIFDKRQTLLNQSRLLMQARDRLLPKLMSGELEV